MSRFIPAFKDLRVYDRPLTIGNATVPLQREITVHDLLTHTAGLTYGGFEDTPVDALYRPINLMNPDRTLEEFVAALVKLPLVFQPGTRWRYSVATDVVGHLVEIVSGMTLDAFFEERIFEPLGMLDSGFNVPLKKLDRLATLYQHQPDGSLTPAEAPVGGRYTGPGGSFRAAAGWSPRRRTTCASPRCCSTAACWMASG